MWASLQSRRLCHCCNNVFALITMALLLSLSWCHCPHHKGIVCHNGIVAFIALAPLPTLHGCCRSCCAGVVVLIVLTSLPSRRMGIVTVVALALLSPSRHVCAIALVSWHCCPWCTCISPLMRRPICPCCACIVQSIHRCLCPC